MTVAPVGQSVHDHLTEHRGQPAPVAALNGPMRYCVAVTNLDAWLAVRTQVQVVL